MISICIAGAVAHVFGLLGCTAGVTVLEEAAGVGWAGTGAFCAHPVSDINNNADTTKDAFFMIGLHFF
ncbi:hypothetical protein SBF1_200014 [Candidatus Desulfosporosinus infrequens]|uniref:Uncharacterized protein n=1 Tax=Candidatus Desulfosporosinus infrequens TaxID=2043169 RepID=A0A2U3KHI5_9FIRM|nr:hypothetical protein SBF1_200014 [Candidatus Desulfosporosinus infrequens]